MSRGQELWIKAKQFIPGGGMLLSKRPDLFLPDYWPVYFQSERCSVWDLDNKKYLDASIMGIGTNLLGYANKIDHDKRVVDKSSMGTFYCQRGFTRRKASSTHPWSNIVRFAFGRSKYSS